MDLEKPSLGRKIEIYMNTLNRIMIWSASLYITWHCWNFQSKISAYTIHVWMSTIGYQLLMTESILTFYTENSWSIIHTPKTKRTIHWVLQLIGSIFAIVGTLVLYVRRRRHFSTLHSITGLISLILLMVGVVNGLSALWGQELHKMMKLKPVYVKFFHNWTGIAAFVFGMISLYYGYKYSYFKASNEMDIRPCLISFLIGTTVLSLVGAVKSSNFQLRTILRR